MHFVSKILAALLCILLAASPAGAGSMLLTGVGPPPVAAGGGFVGAGDLSLSTGVSKVWVAVQRCYSTSSTGNVADIWDAATGSTTETLLTCSAGGTINQTINTLATTCASGCIVKKLFDQSGSLACGGAACDLIAQGAASIWPTVSLNFSNSRACMNIANGSATLLQSAAVITTLAQAFSISVVSKRTAGTVFTTIFGAVSSNALLYNNAVNQVALFAGGVATATASDSALHSVQAVFNNASSSAYVDVTTNTGLAPGAGNISGLAIGVGAFSGNSSAFTFCEGGAWAGGFSGGDQTAVGANQHGTDGYNF